MNEEFTDDITAGPFEPTWEPLTTYQCLEWFHDANAARHDSKVEAVYNGKNWNERVVHGEYREGIGVLDLKRGGRAQIGTRDIRFTQAKDGSAIYAIALGWSASGTLSIKALAREPINNVQLLSYTGEIEFSQNASGLQITLSSQPISDIACSLKIT